MERTVLYSNPISHWCISADRMLAFKGVPFETVYVPYHNHQELLRLSGQDYIPVLKSDGRVLRWFEIPDFLEKEVPTPTFYPWGQRGLATLLEQWGHAVIEERVWRAVVTKVPKIFVDEQERWVFEEMQNRARGPWEVLELREPEFRKDLLTHLQQLETTLEGREWILGKPSLADFGIYGAVSPIFTVGEQLPQGLPNLDAWCKRIQALGPSVGSQ